MERAVEKVTKTKKIWRWRLVASGVFFMAMAGSILPVTAEPARHEVLVIAKVSTDPKKHYRTLKPMVDYAAERMKDLGIKEGRVLMAKDNAQMIQFIRQGRVDWVTEPPFSAVLFKEATGAEFLLDKWKKGAPVYHSVLLTRKGSGIRSLKDLAGKVVAFEDPGSTSSYFVPSYMLLKAGHKMVELGSVRERPPADAIGYVFAGQEINVAMWTYKGLVDAGALSNLDMEDDDDVPVSIRGDLEIFHRSANFLRSVEMVRPDLPAPLKKRLREILLASDKDPAAAEVLRAYEKTVKFEEFDKEDIESIQEVREIIKYMKQRGMTP